MRLRGFALSELLVAVAIAGLIVGLLTFLNVDYVGFAQRAVALGQPTAIGARAEAEAGEDRCEHPESVLTAAGNEVDAVADRDHAAVLALSADRSSSLLVTEHGVAGSTDRPLRIVVENRPPHGGSLAAIEVRDETVGVIASRCNLREVCDYDAANAVCITSQSNATNGADASNGAAGGNDSAGHG